MRKFKDTKLHGKLKAVLPHVIDFIGDVLPDRGMLGIVKNLIEKEETISDVHKLELLKECNKELLDAHAYDESDVEFIELESIGDDVVTRRARPIRQYSWIVLLFICYPLAALIQGATIDLPEIILIGMFSDMGIYSILRTTEKGGFPLKEFITDLFKRK